MALKEIKVPEIGDYSEVEIIEVNVEVGDTINEEDSLITLETDKASMEVPAPYAGTIKEIHISLGDKVSKDSLIITIDDASSGDSDLSPKETVVELDESSNMEEGTNTVVLPEIGDYSDVEIIEINVEVGDTVKEEDSLITLETDKASMEVPAPFSGTIKKLHISLGDKVSKGDNILDITTSSSVNKDKKDSEKVQRKKDSNLVQEEGKSERIDKPINPPLEFSGRFHASPAVRRLARVLGIDLSKVIPTGEKGRITKADCEKYVKSILGGSSQVSLSSGDGLNLLKDPDVDFSQFGDTELLSLTRINKLTSKNLHRNWVKIPHVTFYDDADITDLEVFRKSKKTYAEKAGVKITPIVFLIKAAAHVLKEYPRFNSSLSSCGESLILKKYFNIGIAVDTPNGLVVPVIKNVDQKSIFDIAREFMDIVKRGREGKIKPDEMKGACFTISSLGVLGTTGFTPIINMPEVAIIGVSKSVTKPIWDGSEFIPRLMLPLSLSVDHRVIDGALAAKFLTRFSDILKDLREILL